MARRTARSFAVTGYLRDDVAGTSFTSVPGLTLTRAEVKASLQGGLNGQGQLVPGGWADLVCDVCGESAHWCPDLRSCLDPAFVEARLSA